KILAIYNIKGGVGKTSTAVNMGHLAARDGLRVLLWDLDPQGAASFLLRVRPRVKGGGKAPIKGRRELDAAIKGTDLDRLALSLIERMSVERAPVTAFAPRSAAARQYAALWEEVAERGL